MDFNSLSSDRSMRLPGTLFVKPELLITVNAIASYISELQQYASVLLPCTTLGVPWIFDFINEYVNVPDHQYVHCPFLTKIRLVIVQTQQFRHQDESGQLYGDRFHYQQTGLAVLRDLPQLHSGLLKLARREDGTITDTHRNAIMLYLLLAELEYYQRPLKTVYYRRFWHYTRA